LPRKNAPGTKLPAKNLWDAPGVADTFCFWWIGDHAPRHVHVRNANGKKLGRVDVATFEALESWTPPKDLISIIVELKRKGRI
jgi:hypothetical protein